MLEFQVGGMTCAHCEAAVQRAVRWVDPTANVKVDRSAGRVAIVTAADPAAIGAAIDAEGYRVAPAGRSAQLGLAQERLG